MKKHLFLIALVCALLVGCKPDPVLPTVETSAVTEITQTTAITGGTITSDGGAEVTSRGVCWSTNQNPTINDMLTSNGSGVGTFTSSIENLLANTTYYVRAYATNSEGTAYGENFCFVTLEENNDDDNNGGDDNGGDDNGGDDNGGDDNGGDDNGGDDNGGDDNGGDDNGGDDNGGDDNGGDDNGGDDNGGDEIVVELPTVTVVVVSGVTINSAMLSAEVLTDGGADVTERGFYWNKANASSEANFVKVGENVGAYTYQLTGLQESTEYNVGAYAVNSEGMVKSEIVSFTTLKNEDDDDDEETEYTYVDLGLPSGTLWAEHNVGALFPEGYGDYFAWGEIEPKANYTSDNCSSYNQDLGNISGNPMFDAATANWGDDWRMPTLEEMFELTQECTWTWAEVNGVAGYNVTSKTNGNHIFLPASGFRAYGELIDLNLYGYYWTSTPYEEEGATPTYTKGCFLDMCSYQFYCNWSLRRNGMTVRPVRNL